MVTEINNDDKDANFGPVNMYLGNDYADYVTDTKTVLKMYSQSVIGVAMKTDEVERGSDVWGVSVA